MTTGMAGLAAWSFLMAMAHGAGLMLIPLLAPIGAMRGMPRMHAARATSMRVAAALAAVAVHSLAMLADHGRDRACWSTTGSASACCGAAGSISTCCGRRPWWRWGSGCCCKRRPAGPRLRQRG